MHGIIVEGEKSIYRCSRVYVALQSPQMQSESEFGCGCDCALFLDSIMSRDTSLSLIHSSSSASTLILHVHGDV